MNIFRPQKPYVFRPPRYSPWLAPLFVLASRISYLRRRCKVRHVHIHGAEEVATLARSGQSLLIAPNHADHADPHVLLYVGKKYGMQFHFMAAREGFEKSRFYAFVLQKTGAFSVDREGADIRAVKTAMHIIQKGRYPLVIFPEGEIYHHHEKLDELNEGVATIFLRAASKMDGKSCFFVPTALRYKYDESIALTFAERLSVLEERIAWKPRPDIDPVDRIYRLGGGLLALKEEEFLGKANSGNLVDRITALQRSLVEVVEAKHGRSKGADHIPKRVKALRGKIRKQLTREEDAPDDAERRSLYDDLDTLFVAVQLYSYPGQYLKKRPTTHRIAETILKLEEDLLGEGSYPAPQDVFVRFDKPVEVSDFLRQRSLDYKTGIGPMTHYLAASIQDELERAGTDTDPRHTSSFCT